ncbi:hypothetical protein [Dechloromonas sp. A34]|uniref:hypothetical protein n=1 Tax=Dechloromonas sp. A34 TaxID=447588 RepID=UPI0022495358|nr:hypothetical protein [Dechloromonas sp. A34]
MQLIARVTLRRHEMGDAGDEISHAGAARSVAIFRIVGQSPDKALKVLNQEISTHAEPLVALAVDSSAPTAAQQKVYETVQAACHRQSVPVLTCGGDPGKLAPPPLAGYAPEPWFPSIASMVLEFGEGDLRLGGRKAATRG